MQKLCELNNIKSQSFLNGQQEAEAFEKQEYIKLHQSTLAKIEMYSKLLDKAINGNLKTLAKWREIYGISVQSIYEYTQITWWTKLIFWMVTLIIGGIIGAILS